MLHSVSSFESSCKYHTRSVGVRSWSISQFSAGSVSLPACLNARIASDVSLTLPQ